jgi:hypothetical protein
MEKTLKSNKKGRGEKGVEMRLNEQKPAHIKSKKYKNTSNNFKRKRQQITTTQSSEFK